MGQEVCVDRRPIYLWALVVTITSIAEYTSTFVESLFHYGQTPATMLVTSVLLLLLMMAVNMSGTKNLARVAKIGFWCEIVSVIALGIYLLIFHRSQPFSVIFLTRWACWRMTAATPPHLCPLR